MKKTYKYTVMLILVILAMVAVIVFAFLKGTKQEESETSKLEKASIPTLTMACQNKAVNCLRGYSRGMDLTTLNMVLTPLDVSGQLTVHIGDTRKKITAADYTVYRNNGKETVESRRTEKISENKTGSQVILDLSKSIGQNEEYLLEIRLETEDKDAFYYYTRILRQSDFNVEEAVTFVEDFCKNSFNKKANDKITTYIEPDETGDNTTLQHVNIHSSYEQITWGSLKPELCGEPVADILELDPTEAILTLDYQVAVREDEETHSYYLVHEYYRVRRSSFRLHLLEFDREMTQTFTGTRHGFEGQSVVLGILGSEPEYVYAKDGEILCWEQAGELWQYHADGSRLYKIFSLQDVDHEDKRAYMQDYDIHILNMDEKGNVDFAVCGYFNRGPYEGSVGLELCHYAQQSNSYEVRYMLEDVKGEDLFRQETEQLLYLSGNRFWFYHQGAVKQADLTDGSVRTVVEGLKTDGFVAAADGSSFAWVEDPDGSEVIYRMELPSEEKKEISGEKEEYIRPIGYVQTDFAYGKAKKASVTASPSGQLYFPMYSVVICDREGTVIKDYTDENLVVMSGETTEEMITLQRAVPVAGGAGYAAAQSHQIVSSQEKVAGSVKTETRQSDKKQTEMLLQSEKSYGTGSVRRYTAEEKGYYKVEEPKKSSESRQDYVVYEKGRMTGRFRKSMDAFVYAWEHGGTVKDPAMNTLYHPFAADESFQAEDSLSFDPAILQEGLAEGGEGILSAWRSKSADSQVADATGIPLELAWGLAGRGCQVLIRTGTAEYGLIVGYDEENILLRNPVNGQTVPLAKDQAENLYQQMGRLCIFSQ